MRVCNVEGCGKPYHAKGYCSYHYNCVKNNGTLTSRKYLHQMSVEEKFNKYTKRIGDCLIWTGPKARDYGLFILGGGRVLAHRLSYDLYYDDFDEKLFICHHCDTPLCVEPLHLFQGTQADNLQDMAKKHRGNIGSKNINTKLNKEQVIEIRKLAKTEMFKKDIGNIYGVARQTIDAIINNRTWKHI